MVLFLCGKSGESEILQNNINLLFFDKNILTNDATKNIIHVRKEKWNIWKLRYEGNAIEQTKHSF